VESIKKQTFLLRVALFVANINLQIFYKLM